MPKPSSKEDMIAETLRERIIAGELPPGAQLPTYEILERDFGASRMTMNKAISRLKADGFLTGIERRGVFVAEKPPHLDRIALLLPHPPRFNSFSACLEASAKDFTELHGRRIEIFPCLDGPHFSQEEARRILGELEARRFAGIFVAFNPDGCPEQRIFDFKIPKVYFDPGSRRDGAKLSMDVPGLVRKGLERLKERGASRIAVLAYPHDNPSLRMAAKAIPELGLESKSEWRIGMDNPEIAEQIVSLMLCAEPGKRPDGLLLADDHLVEAAARGVVASRIKAPEELKVLSHCNWVLPPPRSFPLELLGFDSDMAMRLAAACIDASNEKRPFEGQLVVPALFEDEMREARSLAAKQAQRRPQ